jgi:S-adenosylmethionine hydrolase
VIAFLSDWGLSSYYVGVAKAAIKEVNRKAEIIDICHDIKPFSIKHGAYVVQRVIRDLPRMQSSSQLSIPAWELRESQ